MRAIRALIVPALAIMAGFGAVPAMAQDAPEPKVNQVIVFGRDPCPESSDDTITVCARKAEAERFRIPEPLREHASPLNEAWSNRVVAYETVGRSGTMSCSPVGAGGWTGCSNKLINQAYEEKRTDPSVHFGEMIAEARAKRLSTIDSEATETQGEVEAQENAMEARQQAQAAQGDKDADDQTAPLPPAPKGN
jgi:hypothetical protein